MRNIEIDELKRIQLDILSVVSKFCDENNIKYYLACGTLLGAIRHKGFIPWDDDIDIIMLRPDYIKFIELFNKKNKNKSIFVDSPEINDDYPTSMARVMNIDTIHKYTEEITKPYVFGVFIDIIPYDNLPDDIDLYEKLYKRIKQCCYIRTIKYSSHTSYNKFYKQIIVLFLKVLFNNFINLNKISKKINKLSQKYNTKGTYVGCYISKYGRKDKIRREVFSEQVDVEFEGQFYKAPVGYHEYLTALYGDYMILPPIEKRIPPGGSFEVFWKD